MEVKRIRACIGSGLHPQIYRGNFPALPPECRETTPAISRLLSCTCSVGSAPLEGREWGGLTSGAPPMASWRTTAVAQPYMVT